MLALRMRNLNENHLEHGYQSHGVVNAAVLSFFTISPVKAFLLVSMIFCE